MNKNTTASINKIIEIFDSGKDGGSNVIPSVSLSDGKGAIKAIEGEKYHEFKECFKSLYDALDVSNKLISLSYFENRTRKLLFDNSFCAESIEGWVNRQTAVEFDCFTFISGLKCAKSFTVGKIKVVSKDDLKLHITSKGVSLDRVIISDRFFENDFNNKICIEFKVSAVDYKFAEEQFDNEINEFVNYLRFLYGERNEFRDIRKESKVEDRESVILFSENGVSATYGGVKKWFPYDISFNFIHSQENANDTITALYEKRNKTQIDSNIIDAINWISLSISELNTDVAVTELALAFETILKHDDGSMITKSIQGQIAENVAFLCGDTMEERLKIMELFKSLYAFRSSVVHGGHKNKEKCEPYSTYLSLFRKTIVGIF